jgi:hypothetical protein
MLIGGEAGDWSYDIPAVVILAWIVEVENKKRSKKGYWSAQYCPNRRNRVEVSNVFGLELTLETTSVGFACWRNSASPTLHFVRKLGGVLMQ